MHVQLIVVDVGNWPAEHIKLHDSTYVNSCEMDYITVHRSMEEFVKELFLLIHIHISD